MRRAAFTAVVAFVVGCSTFPTATTNPDAGGGGALPDLEPAPTYTMVFQMLLAAGTPGHCATAGCHADPGHHVWLCGTTKESCYQGLVAAGLIDPKDPTHSLLVDPANSPLSWINPNGPMPFDSPGPNPTGRAIIEAWVAAGAQDN